MNLPPGVERRVVKVTRTRRAIRAAEEAARKKKVRQRTIEHILDGTYDRIYEETGVNVLAGTEFGPPLHRPSADGGAGRDEMNEGAATDLRTPTEMLTDHIRGVLNDPDRQRERRRLKAGGSHDARDVPIEAPPAVSYPRVPWEQ